MCTQTIVDTMLKESEISGYPAQRKHRTHTPQFKCELVAACQQPGVSIAALAGRHGMNANVLHRWLKEHQRGARHCLVVQPAPHTPGVAAFVPLSLSAPTLAGNTQRASQEIRIELRKGALTMVVTWPVHAGSAAAEFASWTSAVLQ